MKFLDRFSGEHLTELPDLLLPSRYCLLESFEFNGHTRLQVGDQLADDGSGVIRIHGSECHVPIINQSVEDLAESELSVEAISAIAGKLLLAKNKNVSPMLPAEMAAQCELDDLEKLLANVLSNGHLHAISDRPRRDLRYDDLVTPVARARRLATNALSHLASHSDCWQQRTLSGVQPRKILARFSEDDYSIYENRLYKRLLDRLDHHLATRLSRIKGISLRLEQALNFQESDQTHHRLRREICELWGESYQDDKTGIQLAAGRLAMEVLESQLHAVRLLQQRGLYKLVPKVSMVPAQVHRTNILNHDPHYRQLPALWEGLRNDKEDRQLAPEERLVRQQQLQLDYVSYVGLVIRRALDRYKLKKNNEEQSFQRAGRSFVLKHKSYDWVLEDITGEDSLTFIPVAWFSSINEHSENLKSGRVVCWPGTSASTTSEQAIPISPLDLYVVEKMGRLIDEWMIRQVLKNYGCDLGPLPKQVKQLTDNLPQFESVLPNHARLIAPLNIQQTIDIKASLDVSANQKINDEVNSAIEQVSVLAELCGHLAKFSPNPELTFYCKCEHKDCETTWTLMKLAKKRHFSMRPKGGASISTKNGFTWSGRDWLDFDIN